ncbi:ArnT family glycosyltransferase [Candidatus Pelagibacter sp. Uisw_136]|uniref:ArnT family glycosyltransferase n=1 Tax=Candidatus Pelagibacter sp. Uisw_136 TaxID=3230991 RepID=UPI0039E93EC9
MKINLSKEKFFVIISLLSLPFFFYLSINTLSYIFDGGHHGSILLNGLDIINGKIPYQEIFLQYGYLNALINSIFLTIFDQNILAIYSTTSLFYFLSILFISLLSRNFSNNYGLVFSIIICIFNHPIPEYPWPNYSAFFFLVMSIYVFNVDNNKRLFISGFFIALACLTRENFYYFIIPSFLIINLLIYFSLKNKIKNYFLITGFLLPIGFFIVYLISNNIFFNWVEFQTLPFVYLKSYETTFFTLLQKFIYFFISEVPFKLAISPQYIPILFILIFNTYVFFEELFFKKDKNIKIIFITLLCLSSLIVSINLELFRLYTSVLIGLPVIFYKLNSFKMNDIKFIILFILLFISCFSFYFFPKGNVKFFKNINYEKSISYKEIKYFKNQKWEADKWNLLKTVKLIDDEIIKKCKINHILNLTPNGFILAISRLERIQMAAIFNEHLGKDFHLIFQKNFKNISNNMIMNEDIYIYSMENMIDVLDNNLDNYKISHRIKVKGYKGSEMRVFVPKKCYNNLNL